MGIWKVDNKNKSLIFCRYRYIVVYVTTLARLCCCDGCWYSSVWRRLNAIKVKGRRSKYLKSVLIQLHSLNYVYFGCSKSATLRFQCKQSLIFSHVFIHLNYLLTLTVLENITFFAVLTRNYLIYFLFKFCITFLSTWSLFNLLQFTYFTSHSG